jgi:DNA sulfur modification protein DndB
MHKKRFSSADIVLRGLTGKCGNQPVFLGFAPSNLLYSLSFADVLNEDTGEGYQRKFSHKHSLDFRRYIRQPASATIPLTFNLRPESRSSWRFYEKAGHAELRIKAGSNRILSQVDSQHRLGSLSDLNIQLPYMTFMGLSIKDEMRIFSVINSKAKGLSTSLLDYHESKLLNDVAKEKPELYIALRLNDEIDSPWYKQLGLGGTSSIGMTRRTSLRGMQSAVRRFLRASNILATASPDEAYIVVRDFWRAIATLLEPAWSHPRKHFLTKGIGVYALMSLAAQICSATNVSATDWTLDRLLPVVSDFVTEFDWSYAGPLKGLGGEGGAQQAYEIIRARKLSA